MPDDDEGVLKVPQEGHDHRLAQACPLGHCLPTLHHTAVEGEVGEESLKVADILDVIETWQIVQENLVDDVALNELDGIRLDRPVHNELGIAAVVDIFEKQLVEAFLRFGFWEFVVASGDLHGRRVQNVILPGYLEEFAKRKWGELEVRKPPGSAFNGSLGQGGGGRTACDEADIPIGFGKGLEVQFPVLEILDFIEQDDQFVLGYVDAADLGGFRDQFLQPGSVIDRHVNGQEDDVALRNDGFGQQAVDDMLHEPGLADAPRSKQENCPMQVPIDELLVDSIKHSARLDGKIIVIYLPFIPPRIVKCNPINKHLL